MKLLEWITGILVLAGILIVYLVVRQTFSLDAVVIGLVIVIYLQQNQIRKIKREVSEKATNGRG